MFAALETNSTAMMMYCSARKSGKRGQQGCLGQRGGSLQSKTWEKKTKEPEVWNMKVLKSANDQASKKMMALNSTTFPECTWKDMKQPEFWNTFFGTTSFSSEKVMEANVGREKSFSFLQDQKNSDHIKKSLSKPKPGEVVSPRLKAIRKSGLDSVKSSSSSLQGIYCFSLLKKSGIFSNDFLINNSSICIKLSALPKCFCICIS